MSEAKFVSRAVRKKDAQALVTGKPVYTGDLVPGRRPDRQTAAQFPCPGLDRGD